MATVRSATGVSRTLAQRLHQDPIAAQRARRSNDRRQRPRLRLVSPPRGRPGRMADASGRRPALPRVLRPGRHHRRLAGRLRRPRAEPRRGAHDARPAAKRSSRRVARRGAGPDSLSGPPRPARSAQPESVLGLLRGLREPARLRHLPGESVRVDRRRALREAALGHRAAHPRLGARLRRLRSRRLPRIPDAVEQGHEEPGMERQRRRDRLRRRAAGAAADRHMRDSGLLVRRAAVDGRAVLDDRRTRRRAGLVQRRRRPEGAFQSGLVAGGRASSSRWRWIPRSRRSVPRPRTSVIASPPASSTPTTFPPSSDGCSRPTCSAAGASARCRPTTATTTR